MRIKPSFTLNSFYLLTAPHAATELNSDLGIQGQLPTQWLCVAETLGEVILSRSDADPINVGITVDEQK